MGTTEEKIIVTIVDANDKPVTPKPLQFVPEPPKKSEAIIKQLLAAGHGRGLLVLLPAGVPVMNEDWVKAGNYIYRVTGAGTCGSSAKVPEPKTFAAMGVARPSWNHYVRPPELDGLCGLLKSEQYVAVCGGRQTGKSTLAYALADELRQQAAARGRRLRVFYVQFGERTRNQKDVDSFWHHMADDLLGPAASRHGVPERFAEFQQAPNQAHFVLTLERADCEEWFLFDDAAQVDDEVCDEFVDALHQSKNTQETTLRGVVLFGVHHLQRMLSGQDIRLKRGVAALEEGITSQGLLYAEEHSDRPAKKRTTAPEHGLAAEEVVAGGSSSPPVSLPSAATCSRYAWTRPFLRAPLAQDLQPFTVHHVSQLLQQHASEAQAAGAKGLTPDQVSAVAESIVELTAGAKGLTGFCLQWVGNAVAPISTPDQWEHFSRFQLVPALMRSPVFQRMTGILAAVFPSREKELQLQRDSQAWSTVQVQQAVLMSVLHSGHRRVPRKHLADLDELFAEGLLGVPPVPWLTSTHQLTDDSWGGSVTVQLCAPVLAACLLRHLAMTAVMHEGPPGGHLEIMWLLRQVIKNLELDRLEKEQALLVSGKTVEYTFQCQTYLLVHTILRLAQQPYRVVGAARSWQSDGRMRLHLDLLLCDEDGDNAQYGLELLAGGTTASIQEHWRRAILQSRLHARRLGGQPTPCKMYVVNFECHPAASRPAASATAPFDADTWAPEFPPDHPDVMMVHIMVDRVEKVAYIATTQQGAACHKERVAVEHVPATGARRVCLRGRLGEFCPIPMGP